MTTATLEQRQLIRKVYRRVYQREWGRKHYVSVAKVNKADTERPTVRFKDERPDHTIEYCQCGCGAVLTGKRYTEHYQTRECFIGTFHKAYHENAIQEPV